jgi:hypothetical protein
MKRRIWALLFVCIGVAIGIAIGTALHQSTANAATGWERVEIINLDDGDLVNGDNFTVVGKMSNFAVGHNLELKIYVKDLDTMETFQGSVQVQTR